MKKDLIKNIIFDFILFFFIFPFLLMQTSRQTVLYNLSITILILSHVYLIYARYILNKKIYWEKNDEYIALIIALTITYTGFTQKNAILSVLGLVMFLAHYKKLIKTDCKDCKQCKDCKYYF